MNLSSIYRIESGETKITKAFLNILKIRFAANPDWIMTGEGDMFISPEEYIDKGIALLGEQKIGAGIISVLRDSRYEKLQSFIETEKAIDGKMDDELKELLQQVVKVWGQGDERNRRTVVQFVKAFLENGK